MELHVIITTYNSRAWLQKVLWGLSNEIFSDFEVITADNDSTDDTKRLIDEMRNEVFCPIQHMAGL